MQTKEVNKAGIGIGIIIVVVLIWAISQIAVSTSGSGGRDDKDCIEWGIEVENPNGTKSWAFTPADPRNREEAEEMAHNMELQDRGGRYYKARCRKYKGD